MDVPNRPDYFEARVVVRGEHPVVELHGELDMASAPQLDGCLRELAEAGAEAVTLDLSKLDFCDSSGVAVFVRWSKPAAEDSPALQLRGATGTVRRVFEVAGLSHLLDTA
ncbi:MAG: STAS domain-containing protein [Actinobacteria bacterium]|nr:STAS domain-containing protein [Actinomycetota bacterium]